MTLAPYYYIESNFLDFFKNSSPYKKLVAHLIKCIAYNHVYVHTLLETVFDMAYI
jgi:hypothetical protein